MATDAAVPVQLERVITGWELVAAVKESMKHRSYMYYEQQAGGDCLIIGQVSKHPHEDLVVMANGQRIIDPYAEYDEVVVEVATWNARKSQVWSSAKITEADIRQVVIDYAAALEAALAMI